MSNSDINFAADYYRSRGWTVIRTSGGAADIIAGLKSKVHFIKLYSGDLIIRGEFVQNAFSNNAIPVYATIITNKSGEKNKIQLLNANENRRIKLKKLLNN